MKREYGPGSVLKMAAWAIACAWVQVSLLAETVVTFELLGDLPGGEFRSGATAVSGDGSVVVGTSNAGDQDLQEACYWKDGNMVSLGIEPGALVSYASGVSDDGSVIVGGMYFNPPGVVVGCRWENGILELLRSTPSIEGSEATAMTSDCNKIVGVIEEEIYYWDHGQLTLYNGIPRIEALALDGTVGFGSVMEEGVETPRVFRWVKGGEIQFLENANFNFVDVSSDGSRVLGAWDYTVYLWENGNVTELGPGHGSCISSDGSIVVSKDGVLWKENIDWQPVTLASLLESNGIDTSGLDFEDIAALSTDKTTIVGTVQHSGIWEAFRIRMVESSPTTWAGYPITEETGNVDTALWMGLLHVASAPWVWCFGTECWFNMEESVASNGEGWVYPSDQDTLWIVQVDGTDWGYSFTLEKWLYLTASGWVYLV